MEIFSHSQLGTPPSSWQSTQLITLWKQALSFIAAWKTKWDSSWEGNQLSPSSGSRTLDQPPGSGASHLGHSGLQSLTFIHRCTVLDWGPPMGSLGPSSASHQTQHGGRHSPKHLNGPRVDFWGPPFSAICPASLARASLPGLEVLSLRLPEAATHHFSCYITSWKTPPQRMVHPASFQALKHPLLWAGQGGITAVS